jgi:3-hydroxy-D-aspartate aldolase
MPKLHRVARWRTAWPGRGGRLGVAVDSAEGIERLAEALAQSGSDAGMDVLVEIDVGQGRCGVPPGEAAVALALAVARHPRLRFAGLQAYHGRAQHLAQRRRTARSHPARAVQQAAHTRASSRPPGCPCRWSPAPAPAPW